MSKPLEPISQERLAIGCAIFLFMWVAVLLSFIVASLLKATQNA